MTTPEDRDWIINASDVADKYREELEAINRGDYGRGHVGS